MLPPNSPTFLAFFLFAFIVVLDKQVCARPTIISPTLFSIPIIRPDNQASLSKYSHGSIIQQQHINRGIRRLALMTGHTPPSEHELLLAMSKRISLLSKAVRRHYKLERTAEVIALYLTSLYTSGSAKPISSSSLLSRAEKTADTNSTHGAFSHSIGLDIESNDIGYMGTMKIGTPPKDFRLLIDSGSADLWVGGEGCRGNDGGNCGNHTFLGPDSSKSYNGSKEEWTIGYVSGFVSGVLAQDDVSIDGLMLNGHRFGIALNESSDFTPDDIPFDGLLGLAKSLISQQRIPTFLQSLYQANLIPAPIVSYKIPRLADGKNDGEITLGGMDPRKYHWKSLVKRKNVNKFGFWGVAVDAVKVGKRDMHWTNRTIVLDTGTTLIIAPQADVDAIHHSIPGARYDGGGWTVPCNMTTSLSLTIGGQLFPIDPRDIAFYPVDEASGECMSGIGVGGVGPFYLNTEWLVGDVFLKNVYFSTDENKDEISIAKTRL